MVRSKYPERPEPKPRAGFRRPTDAEATRSERVTGSALRELAVSVP